ncbi:peroxisomal biogenesis factor 6-like [Olea europaea var. sylvestris]|uniref:peroxisomal biogenesis factor 6-like n=1 Tax=Olea europaea var. sylvestris TaxID=158386 RepID=UPI000C1CEE75|nr:peroxisomal biogenesis factor 6-like [Olea europaea var. sylvestris]
MVAQKVQQQLQQLHKLNQQRLELFQMQVQQQAQMPGLSSFSSSCTKSKTLEITFENEFERRIWADVIPRNEIGVKFDDIGALDNIKDTLKELVMLPLQRPELFCKGQLRKVALFPPICDILAYLCI